MTRRKQFLNIVSVTLAFAGVTTVVTAGLIYTVNASRSTADGAEHERYDASLDPALGQVLLDTKRVVWFGKKRSTALLALAAGPCQSCSLITLDHNRISELKSRPVIAIIEGTGKLTSSPEKTYRSFDGYIQLTADEYERLNPAWSHRAYQVDAAGKLIASQPYGVALKEFDRQ